VHVFGIPAASAAGSNPALVTRGSLRESWDLQVPRAILAICEASLYTEQLNNQRRQHAAMSGVCDYPQDLPQLLAQSQKRGDTQAEQARLHAPKLQPPQAPNLRTLSFEPPQAAFSAEALEAGATSRGGRTISPAEDEDGGDRNGTRARAARSGFSDGLRVATDAAAENEAVHRLTSLRASKRGDGSPLQLPELGLGTSCMQARGEPPQHWSRASTSRSRASTS
jgi:hypothetical protein